MLKYHRLSWPEDILHITTPVEWDETNESDAKIEPLGGHVTSNYMICMAKMQEMKPFITYEEYVGMGPSTLSPRYVIMVLIGAAVPFALRQSQEKQIGFP